MFENIVDLFGLSRRFEKSFTGKIVFIAFLNTFTVILELSTFGSLYAFVNVVFNNEKLSELVNLIGLFFEVPVSEVHAVSLMACVLVLCIICATFIKIFILNIQLKFAQSAGVKLSLFLLSIIFESAFLRVRQVESSFLIALVTTKTNRVVNQTLVPFLQMISASMIMIGIISFLMLVNPLATCAIFFAIGVFFFIIMRFARPRLRIASSVMSVNLSKSVDLAKQSVLNIRSIILDDRFDAQQSKFEKNEYAYRSQQRRVQLLSLVPKHFLEAIIVVFAVIYIAISYNAGSRVVEDVGYFAIMAFSAQRLLPLMQQVYAGSTQIQSNQHIIKEMISFCSSAERVDYGLGEVRFSDTFGLYEAKISIDQTFCLPDVTLEIKRGEVVGVIGPTGHGKSTLVDSLIGLNLPTEGILSVDGQLITHENVKSWYRCISQVPQFPVFESNNLRECFYDVDPAISDHEIVRFLKMVDLQSFVSRITENQLDIGENGALLSGGQRQRLALALVLAADPEVLVLDEATSALDRSTEVRVLDSLMTYKSPELTIIMITHNRENLIYCDVVYEVKDGSVSKFIHNR